jgi:hypothetical protein
MAGGRVLLAALLALQPAALRRLAEPSIDGRVLAVACGLALLWGALFALAPLGAYLRSDLVALLGSARSGGQGLRLHARSAFVVAQVAATAVLLVSAGLLTRTFLHIGDRSRLPRRRPQFLPRAGEPAIARGVPHRPGPPRPSPGPPRFTSVPGVGAVSHLPLLAALPSGRSFTDADDTAAPRVAVVDDMLAARAWPGESPLGKRLRVDPGSTGSPTTWVTVVGVVRHVRHRSLVARLGEQIYFPLSQAFRNPVAYAVRTTGDPAQVGAAVRAAVKAVDPGLPIYEEQPLAAYLDGPARSSDSRCSSSPSSRPWPSCSHRSASTA